MDHFRGTWEVLFRSSKPGKYQTVFGEVDIEPVMEGAMPPVRCALPTLLGGFDGLTKPEPDTIDFTEYKKSSWQRAITTLYVNPLDKFPIEFRAVLLNFTVNERNLGDKPVTGTLVVPSLPCNNCKDLVGQYAWFAYQTLVDGSVKWMIMDGVIIYGVELVGSKLIIKFFAKEEKVRPVQ